MRRSTGQFTIPLPEVLPSRPRLRASLIVPGVVLSLVLAVGNAAGQCTGCNTTGAWTHYNDTGANWGYPQIHLALLRGGTVNGVNYHSYLISWAGTNSGASTYRGLHGWNPGDPSWSTYTPNVTAHRDRHLVERRFRAQQKTVLLP